MSKVSKAFNNKKALITYITAGDPSLSATEKLVYSLEKAGADIVELGVPFSDPLADGPVIQASHLRALKTSLLDVFKLVKKIRKKSQIPIVLMLSDNLVVRYGEEKFYRDCQGVGVNGVIIPDLPPEQYVDPKPKAGGVDQVFLVAPTSSDKRIKLIAAKSSGFIYLVSLTGITGQRKDLSSGLGKLVAKIKKYANKPVAIGFGISNPNQAAAMAKLADGVIVGSALVDLIAKNKNSQAIKLVKALRRALDGLN